MTPQLSEFIQASLKRIDAALERALARLAASDEASIEQSLLAAMRYSLLNGGKRIRPILVYASASLAGPTPGANQREAEDAIASAVECIHAYSLVHDDLPAMDDDDLRRGQPTCHIAFDEATAILAGDALQTLAFDCVSHCAALDWRSRVQLMQLLGQAAGARGMVAGQAMDLASVDKPLSLAQLQAMHNHKTGALIKASVLMGAAATGELDTTRQRQLETYADAIGLAFQVQDDILDVISDTATLGKQQGADIAKNKPTYVSLLGLDGARQKAGELHQQALQALADCGSQADILRQLSSYIVGRVR